MVSFVTELVRARQQVLLVTFREGCVVCGSW